MIKQIIYQRLNKIPWNHVLEKINFFEQNYDSQFKSIEKIIKKYPQAKWDILFWVIQNALISYQLSWTWENRWEEFSSYIIDNIDNFLSNNCLFWQKFLKNCKYNLRFRNVKLERIKKTLSIYNTIKNNWKKFYKNMTQLNKLLAFTMKQDISAKTIVFAIKMFWYWARINYKFIPYPFEIDIPVDSRIKKIYLKEKNINQAGNKEIINYFRQISRQIWVPPLHLDSLLWVKEEF